VNLRERNDKAESRSAREFEGIHDHLYNSKLKFKHEDKMLELAGFIVDLAYVTRVQEFNV